MDGTNRLCEPFVLDIKAIDRIGRRFNIEVQTTRPLGLAERLTYYAAKRSTS